MAPRPLSAAPVVAPMLARSGALPANDPRWQFEVKWDGIRAVTRVCGTEREVRSRSGIVITDRFPELDGLRGEMVLDGELIAFDADGRPSFAAIQQRSGSRPNLRVPVSYAIFDLLWLDGEDLTGLGYGQRRDRLEALGLAGDGWSVSARYEDGARLAEQTRERGIEGVMAKRVDSRYQPGRRSDAWRKVKHLRREQFVIGGWLPGEGSREQLGALALGRFGADGRLVYRGRVGSGLSVAEVDQLSVLLARVSRSDSPFAGRGPRGVRYVEPVLVCEVTYTELTRTGQLRHPVFQRVATADACSIVDFEAKEA